MIPAWQPRTKREARRWVREHWQEAMFTFDVPDVFEDADERAAQLILDVWREESERLAGRLEPKKRA